MTTSYDHYETLQVHPKADAAAIEAAYQRLRERYDLPGLDGAADELLELARAKRDAIEYAYAVLGDPAAPRAAYDAEHQAPKTGPQEPGRANQAPAAPHVPATTARSSPSARPTSAASTTGRCRRPGARKRPARRGRNTLCAGAAGRAARPGRAPCSAPAGPALDCADRAGRRAGADRRQQPAADQWRRPAAAPTATPSPFDIWLRPTSLGAQSFAEQNSTSAQAWIDLGNLLYDSAQIVREQAPDSPVYQQRLGRWFSRPPAPTARRWRSSRVTPPHAPIWAPARVSTARAPATRASRRRMAEVRRAATIAPDDARVLISMGHCLRAPSHPRSMRRLPLAARDRAQPFLTAGEPGPGADR
ncbi:MAG: hypothetical protein U0Z44_19240 [Kouleothrix sp.]